MIYEHEIENVVNEQRSMLQKTPLGLPRKVQVNEKTLQTHALMLTGVRRCGKSTAMYQRMQSASDGTFFLNFESPLLVGIDLKDTARINSVIRRSGAKSLYLDEIHALEGWEIYVRQLLDLGYRVCITGSNSRLLKGELATKLTGRHISVELFPFDYLEYLEYTNQAESIDILEKYIRDGGFPLYLQTQDKAVLLELFDDIIYRDIIVPHKIREVTSLRRLAMFLAENIGCRISASKLVEPLNASNNVTISQWCDYLSEAYLFFFIPFYSESEKSQLINPRKVYCIDTGLEQAVSVRIIPNDGLRFENLVFLAIRRKYKEIFYFSQKGECDFVVTERHCARLLVQACTQMDDLCQEREVNGLATAMRAVDLHEGFIVTKNQREEIDIPEGKVHVIPYYDFVASVL